MTSETHWPERAAWIALTAILFSFVVWLGMLCVLWLCAGTGCLPGLAAAAVVARAAAELARHAWPLLLLLPPAAIMLALAGLALRPAGGKARHV